MMESVRSKVKMNAKNFVMFVNIFKEIEGLEEVVQLVQAPIDKEDKWNLPGKWLHSYM